MPKLSDVIAALEVLWPPEQAEQWDSVGLVCGEPDTPVTRVLCAVDPVPEIVDEAAERRGPDRGPPPAAPARHLDGRRHGAPDSRAGSCTS